MFLPTTVHQHMGECPAEVSVAHTLVQNCSSASNYTSLVVDFPWTNKVCLWDRGTWSHAETERTNQGHNYQIFGLLSVHVTWGHLTTMVNKEARSQCKDFQDFQFLPTTLRTSLHDDFSGHHLSLGIFSPLPLFGDCGTRPLAIWNEGLLLFLREYFIKSSTCCTLGLGSGSAGFWSPALPIKREGAEQYGRELSGDRIMPELLPKTQAGSKSVALRWKHLLGSTMGVYLNRWPCGERLRVPLPTAGWQADLFLWALKAHTVGQA